MSQTNATGNWGWYVPTEPVGKPHQTSPGLRSNPRAWFSELLRVWEIRRVVPLALSIVTDLTLIVIATLLWYALLSSAFPTLNAMRGQLDDAIGLLILGGLIRLFSNIWAQMYPGYGLSSADKLAVRGRTWGVVVGLTILLAVNDWSERQLAVWVQLLMLPMDMAVLPLAQSWLREGLLRMNCWGRPVAVVAEGEVGRRVLAELQRYPKQGFFPAYVLHLDDGQMPTDEKLPHSIGWSHLRRSSRCLCTCIVATTTTDTTKLARLRRRLSFLSFRRILLIRNRMDMTSYGSRTCWVGQHMAVQVRRNLSNPFNLLFKRLFDLMLSIPAAIITLPIIGLAALAIKIVDPKGSPFYVQQREGIHGQTFGMWKLRTMCMDAEQRLQNMLDCDPQAREQWERYCKLHDDPRILPVIGGFLRKFSIDEIPQILQIVFGQMSIVGPRPFPQYHTAQYSSAFRSLRRTAKPGLTGLWQVEVRSEGDIEQQEYFDTQYIENWSLWLDFYLVLRTVPVVMRGNSAW